MLLKLSGWTLTIMRVIPSLEMHIKGLSSSMKQLKHTINLCKKKLTIILLTGGLE